MQADVTARGLLKLAPNLADAHRLQSEVLLRLGLSMGAEEAVQEAIRLAPVDPANYQVLALIQFTEERYRHALRSIAKAREFDPTSAVLAAQHAEIMLYAKGAKAAEPFAREALALRNDDIYVLTEIARVLLLRERLEPARGLLREVLQRNADNEGAISLYLLTDQRFRLLRWRVQFSVWRKTNGLLGWVVWFLGWSVIFAPIPILAVMWTNSLAILALGYSLAIGYFLFWRGQYAEHRKRVRAHFSQPRLKPGF